MTIPSYSHVDSQSLTKVLAAITQFLNNAGIVSQIALLANAANQVLTVAQMITAGHIVRSGGVTLTDTTPTAAQLIAAMPGIRINDTFRFSIQNQNTGVLTLAAGTGVTLSGVTTVTNGQTRDYIGYRTGASTITILGVRTATS